jgi:hypothetical protein
MTYNAVSHVSLVKTQQDGLMMDTNDSAAHYRAAKNLQGKTVTTRFPKLPAGISRNYLNYTIDVAALVSGLLCAVTGIVKWPGLVYSLGLSYQSLPMEALTVVHYWTGLIMVVLLAIHLLLHAKWMAVMTGRIAGLKGGQR